MGEPVEFVRAPRKLRIGVGVVVVIVVGALAITIGIGVFRSGGATAAVSPSPAFSMSTGSAEGVYVHVSGAVNRPGLYPLSGGDRVADAVAAAGGFAADAARDGVNLAREVADGEQLAVPRIGEQAPSSQPGGATGASGGVLNLNTATSAELEELPRIGPALAQRIVQWREENGPFRSVEDLLLVSGIGEKMLAGIRDQVRV